MGILNGYRVKDLFHFLSLYRRHKKRNKIWVKHFDESLKLDSYKIPFPVVIQILPTERCNLSCKMCNQWGERGYYHSHDEAAGEMPIENLISFLQSIESRDYLLNIHGGEPFFYSHMDKLLDYLLDTERDTLFTTNATLLDKYLPKLGRLKNALYFVSIDGGQEVNDKIRGAGTFQKIKNNLEGLKKSCLEQTGIFPYLSMNFCASGYIKPQDIFQGFKVARELGFFNLNYGLLWFTTDKAGHEYERQLKDEFQITATDCWKALLCDLSFFDANGVAQAIHKVKRNLFKRLRLPYVSITPKEARRPREIERHFLDYGYTHGREKCLSPFYFSRIHSDGSVIFCQGFRDVIAGNVFYDDFVKVFNSEIAQKFRRFCMRKRFSICSRCCSFYVCSKIN